MTVLCERSTLDVGSFELARNAISFFSETIPTAPAANKSGPVEVYGGSIYQLSADRWRRLGGSPQRPPCVALGPKLVWQDVDNLSRETITVQILDQIKSSMLFLSSLVLTGWRTNASGCETPKMFCGWKSRRAQKERWGHSDAGRRSGHANRQATPVGGGGLIKRHGIALSDTDRARDAAPFQKLQDVVRAVGTTEPPPNLHSNLERLQSRYFRLMISNPAERCRWLKTRSDFWTSRCRPIRTTTLFKCSGATS